MTGEDMIIQEAAALLNRSGPHEHLELRACFAIASRCPRCGQPLDESKRCLDCDGKPSPPTRATTTIPLPCVCGSNYHQAYDQFLTNGAHVKTCPFSK